MAQENSPPSSNAFPKQDGAAVRAAATWVTMLVYETKTVPEDAKLFTAKATQVAAAAITQLSPPSFGPGPFSQIPPTAIPVAASTTTLTQLTPTDAGGAFMPTPTESSPISMSPAGSPPMTMLSRSTQRIVIIVATIGGTLVIGILVYMIYRLRMKKKRRKPELELEADNNNPSPSVAEAPAPIEMNWNNASSTPWQEAKNSWDANSSTRSIPYNSSPATINRSGTGGSNRPLVSERGLISQVSIAPSNRTTDAESTDDAVSFILLNKPQQPIKEFAQKLAREPAQEPAQEPGTLPSPSTDASSPILPIEIPDQISEGGSELSIHSTPPQFSRLAMVSRPKASHFSWTNSQAPKTPLDSRFSTMMSASTWSLPRYRTVDSWVGQQTGHLSAAKIQEHLRQEIEGHIRIRTGSLDEAKDVIKQLSNPRDTSLFGPHPGTKVPLPRVSLIPSEILESEFGTSGALEHVLEEE